MATKTYRGHGYARHGRCCSSSLRCWGSGAALDTRPCLCANKTLSAITDSRQNVEHGRQSSTPDVESLKSGDAMSFLKLGGTLLLSDFKNGRSAWEITSAFCSHFTNREVEVPRMIHGARVWGVRVRLTSHNLWSPHRSIRG